MVAVFSTILMLLTIGEYVSARREPDDVVDTTSEAIRMKNVITNPALTYSRGGGGGEEDPENRGRRHPGSNGSISVSRTSGLPPYVHPLTLKFKYNSTPSNNNIYVQRGSRRGQKKSPSSSRRRSSSRKTPPKPFGKDLPSPSWNGSANSITTSPPESTVNGAGNGSTVSDYSSVSTVSTLVSGTGLSRAGPLRSSLKKTSSSRGGSETGFSNPGFAGSSPTLSRSSSVKKVRIQSPMDVSTDV